MVVGFLSFELVLAIAVVVVVGKLKEREVRRERRLLMMSFLHLIGYVYEIEQL